MAYTLERFVKDLDAITSEKDGTVKSLVSSRYMNC